jgi:hypothetical protein
MMDFLRTLHTLRTLRTLAPSHAAAKTRAVPVVRSRFEDSRPLAHPPAAHLETSALESIAEPREMAGIHRAITRSVEPARDDDAASQMPADRNVVTTTESRVTLSRVAEQPSVPSTPQPLSVHAVPATREAAERRERARAVPRGVERPAILRAAQPVSAPLSIAPSMPEPVGSPAARGPLSSGTVAARSESRSDGRPIIHVTIDRIDVRAPSVPERASSRPRSRSNTSASLSDYLRSRQSSRSGGTT